MSHGLGPLGHHSDPGVHTEQLEDSRLEIACPAPPRLDERHRGGGPHRGEHQSRHTATAAEIHDRTRRAADHPGGDVGEASGVLDVRSDGPGPEGAVIASPFEHPREGAVGR